MKNESLKILADNEQNIEVKLREIYATFPATKPGKELLGRILTEINFKKALKLRIKIMTLSSLSLISLFSLVYFWSFAITQIAGSEAQSILKLVFSDIKSILADWQYFILYFLEAFPVMPIIYALSSTLAVMAFARALVMSIYNRNKLIHI